MKNILILSLLLALANVRVAISAPTNCNNLTKTSITSLKIIRDNRKAKLKQSSFLQQRAKILAEEIAKGNLIQVSPNLRDRYKMKDYSEVYFQDEGGYSDNEYYEIEIYSRLNSIAAYSMSQETNLYGLHFAKSPSNGKCYGVLVYGRGR